MSKARFAEDYDTLADTLIRECGLLSETDSRGYVMNTDLLLACKAATQEAYAAMRANKNADTMKAYTDRLKLWADFYFRNTGHRKSLTYFVNQLTYMPE